MHLSPPALNSGLEVIKLEFIPKLKIKRNDWLLPIVTLYYEFEIVLKFYNLEACSCVELIGHNRIALSILEPP